MKKISILLIALVMALSLIACSKPALEHSMAENQGVMIQTPDGDFTAEQILEKCNSEN
ncbi:MAG: hypothetical protein RR571_07025 [Anaerorhabdus sp.]|uniref:hypothetical protein n=1 Tax=Anaerorhabdus sp. TaxID=1872524 RepID=UPI002FC8504A